MRQDVDYFAHAKEYIINDFNNPKVSTKSFFNFLQKYNSLDCMSNEIILDIGAGGCSGTAYFAKKKKSVDFYGVDYNKELVKWVNEVLWVENKQYKLENLNLIYGDWNNPEAIKKDVKGSKIKCIISVHSLCTQKNFRDSMESLISLDSEFIAINSLFYNGPLDVLIHIRDNKITDDNPDADFNIHSLTEADKFMLSKGYKNIFTEFFEINLDLPKPLNGERGTYTINSSISKYTQFSGPVFLPWHFVLYKRFET